MKKFSYFLGLAAGMLMASCTGEDLNGSLLPEPEKGEPMQITVGMPGEGDTRVSYDDDAVSNVFKWEAGDKLLVVGYNHEGYNSSLWFYAGQTEFTMNEADAGNNAATFTGNAIEGAISYDVYYKAKNLKVKDYDDGEATIDYSGQTQQGNVSTAHLKDYLLLKSKTDKLTPSDLQKGVQLQMQNALLRLDIESLGQVMQEDKVNPASLTWICGSSNLGFALQGCTAPTAEKPIKALLCFDPNKVNLGAGEKMKIQFPTSSAMYQASVTSTGGVDYKPNGRYFVSISAENGAGTIKTWTKLNGFKIKTQENAPLTLNNGDFPVSAGPDESGYFTVFYEGELTKIPDGLFQNKSSLQEVILPESVTTIGINAFYDCSNLVTCTMPGVTTLKQNAFWGCKNLVIDSYPTKLATLEQNAFHYCESLTNCNFPASLQSLAKLSFYGCGFGKDGKALTVPVAANDKCEALFGACYRLTEAKLPVSMTKIPERCFEGCRQLKTVNLENLTEISPKAFSQTALGADKEEGLVLPANIRTYGYNSFWQLGCTTRVTFEEPTEEQKKTPLTLGVDMFSNTPQLTTVIFPSDLIVIPAHTFQQCHLTSVNWEKLVNLKRIDEGAFQKNHFDEITVPYSVTAVGVKAFESNYKLINKLTVKAPYSEDIKQISFAGLGGVEGTDYSKIDLILNSTWNDDTTPELSRPNLVTNVWLGYTWKSISTCKFSSGIDDPNNYEPAV